MQTLFVPHEVPAAVLPDFWHTGEPVLHAVVPVVHGLPVLQLAPWLQLTHEPLLLQTLPLPQEVPGATFCPESWQTGVPLVQEIVPVWHGLEGVHAAPLVQATQAPDPLQTLFVPQAVPAGALPEVWQVADPDAHEIVPVVHALPVLQDAP